MQYEVTTELGDVVKCAKGDTIGIEVVCSALRQVIDKGEDDPGHVLIRMANQVRFIKHQYNHGTLILTHPLSVASR